MDDKVIKKVRRETWTYMNHLTKVETWLLTPAKHNGTENFEITDKINYSCSYVIDKFSRVIENGMNFEKQVMVAVGMVNTLIRVYIIDKSRVIISQKYFQSIITMFTQLLQKIAKKLSGDDEDSLMDMADSVPTKLKPTGSINEYATNILESLLTNFAEDDLLKKCLKLFFSNAVTSYTAEKQSSVADLTVHKKVLIDLLDCTSGFAYKAVIRSADEFSKNYQPLMKDLCRFVNHFFVDINNCSVNLSYWQVMRRILSIVWNLTDKTPLVPMFDKAGYAEASLEWVKKLTFGHSRGRLDNAIMSIIHNLSRHRDGLLSLRTCHAFKVLMNYKVETNVEDNSELDNLTQALGMSLIALATSDTEQEGNKKLICRISEKLYKLCKKAESRPNWRCNGYHLSELLNSLECAFTDTSVVRHILDNKSNVKPAPIKFFAQLLTSVYGLSLNANADDPEKLIVKSLLKILLCISNYAEYRTELKDHAEFYVFIESFAKRPKQDLAKRIYCNLNLDNDQLPSYHQLKNYNQPIIYISYNWADIELCRELVELLGKSAKFPIWVGYENIDRLDDVWDHLASAIERAIVIIVLVSSRYCNSIYNYQELNYAGAVMRAQLRDEKNFFVFVETERGNASKREWMQGFSNGKKIFVHDGNIEQTVDQILTYNMLWKKRPALITHSFNTVPQSSVCTIM